MTLLYDLLFICLGLALAGVSWRSLRDPGSHGFYRLFVFEAALLLLWRALPVWFEARFAWYQLISWGLLFVALYLLLHSLYLLRSRGGQGAARPGQEANFAFENTASLVESGLYRWVRHPMYSALLLFAWGLFWKRPDLLGGIAAGVATLAMLATARVEERENLATFGEAYRDYMKRTWRFIPLVF